MDPIGNGSGEGSSMPPVVGSSNVLGTEPTTPPVSSFGSLGGNPDVVSAVTAGVNNPGSQQATRQEFTTPFTDPNQGATPATSAEASYPTTPIPITELLQDSGNNPAASSATENTGFQPGQLSSATAEAAPAPEGTPTDILEQKVSDAMRGVSDAIVRFVEKTTKEKVAA